MVISTGNIRIFKMAYSGYIIVTSHKRHDASNHCTFDCLFNNFSRLTTTKTSKYRITGSLWEKSTGHQWIPLTKGNYSGKRFNTIMSCINVLYTKRTPQIARFMGPTWGPPGSYRPQVGPMLVPWTLLSGTGSMRQEVRASIHWAVKRLSREIQV